MIGICPAVYGWGTIDDCFCSPAVYGWDWLAQQPFSPFRGLRHPGGTYVPRVSPTLLSFRWGTHSREPLIDRAWRRELLEIINDEVKTRDGLPIRHNAMPDHAHLLCRLPPNVLIADFIGQVKGATSFRVNKQIRPKFKFQWQEGYGILTIRKDEVEKVSRYIDRQEEHHRRGNVSDLLERYEDNEEDWLKP